MFFFFFNDNDKQNFCLQDGYFQTSVRNFSVWKNVFFFSCKYKKVFGLGKYKNFFSLAGKSVLSGGHKKLCLGKKNFFFWNKYKKFFPWSKKILLVCISLFKCI